jgi:glycosyltransferase involved in cell wall biosynthesis
MSLSVIVASGGRPTLSRTIESIIPQLRLEDELIVVVDAQAPWGHSSRNRAMRWAKGDFLLFQDDDDVSAPGAFDAIRAAVAQHDANTMHVFKMAYDRLDGRTLWEDREVRLGNISTQMIVVPNQQPLGQWGAVYEGDFVFASACAKHRPVAWHEDIISLVRPENC